MLQSCETLITKINEWQQAILELEKLSEEFLNTSDKSLKAEIENQKKEIEKQRQEYLDLAYQELTDGRELFWPEKEMLYEIIQKTGLDLDDEKVEVEVKDNHIVKFFLSTIDLSQLSIDFSLFHNLEVFIAPDCQLKKLPRLSTTIKEIWIGDNPDIEISDDLTYLNNLEKFDAPSCQLKKLSSLQKSVKEILIDDNFFSEEEKERIRKEYPNASIIF